MIADIRILTANLGILTMAVWKKLSLGNCNNQPTTGEACWNQEKWSLISLKLWQRTLKFQWCMWGLRPWRAQTKRHYVIDDYVLPHLCHKRDW